MGVGAVHPVVLHDLDRSGELLAHLLQPADVGRQVRITRGKSAQLGDGRLDARLRGGTVTATSQLQPLANRERGLQTQVLSNFNCGQQG